MVLILSVLTSMPRNSNSPAIAVTNPSMATIIPPMTPYTNALIELTTPAIMLYPRLNQFDTNIHTVPTPVIAFSKKFMPADASAVTCFVLPIEPVKMFTKSVAACTASRIVGESCSPIATFNPLTADSKSVTSPASVSRRVFAIVSTTSVASSIDVVSSLVSSTTFDNTPAAVTPILPNCSMFSVTLCCASRYL